MDAEFLSNSWVHIQRPTQDVPIEATQPTQNQSPIEQPKSIKEPSTFRAWFCGANNYVVTLFVQHTRQQFDLAPGPTFIDLSFSLPVVSEKENDNNFNVQAILGIQDTDQMKIATEKGIPIVEKEDNLNIVVLALCTNNSNNNQSDVHKSIVFRCQELNIPALGVELHSTTTEPTTEFINLQLSLRQIGLPFVTCFVESPDSVKKCIKTIYDVGVGNLVVPAVLQIPSKQTSLAPRNKRKIDCFGMEPNSFASWDEFTRHATEQHIDLHHRIRLLLCGVENSAKAVEEVRHLMVLHLPDMDGNIGRRLAIGVETRTLTEQDLRGDFRQSYTYFDLVFLCWSGQTRNIVENYIPFLENLHLVLKAKKKKCGIVLTILDKETEPNEIIRPAYLWELNLENNLDVSTWSSVALSVVTPSISVEHTKIFGVYLTEAIADILEANISALDTLAPTRYSDILTKMQGHLFPVQWQECEHQSFPALCKMEYSSQLGIILRFTVYQSVTIDYFKAKDVSLSCGISQGVTKFSFQAKSCVGMEAMLQIWRNSLPDLSASFTFECADDLLHKAAVMYLQMRATKKKFRIEVSYTPEKRPQHPKQPRLQSLVLHPLTMIKQGTKKL
mmetsp:Transcript_21551/g.30136  ORF Transcript_21551/g.30136 Transcript_21551/m.30136 type:complete len:615 (+) Transcript_21551:49-1893(+)